MCEPFRMKNLTATLCLSVAVLFGSLGASPGASAAELKILHTDPTWKDGKGDVPDKGICSRRGGKNLSPALEISQIPAGTQTLNLMFTDDDYGSEGGHGDFIVKLNGQNKINIPSFKDGVLPKNMTGGKGHHCSVCSEIDYLGPCSGGRGNQYRVNIYARDSKGKVLAKGTVLLGQF